MAHDLSIYTREIDNSFKHSTPPQDDTQTVGLLPSKPDSFPLLKRRDLKLIPSVRQVIQFSLNTHLKLFCIVTLRF